MSFWPIVFLTNCILTNCLLTKRSISRPFQILDPRKTGSHLNRKSSFSVFSEKETFSKSEKTKMPENLFFQKSRRKTKESRNQIQNRQTWRWKTIVRALMPEACFCFDLSGIELLTRWFRTCGVLLRSHTTAVCVWKSQHATQQCQLRALRVSL